MSSGIDLMRDICSNGINGPDTGDKLKILESNLNSAEGIALIQHGSFMPLLTNLFFSFLGGDNPIKAICSPMVSILNSTLIQNALPPEAKAEFFEKHAFDIFKAVLYRSKHRSSLEEQILPILFYKSYMHADSGIRAMMKSLVATVLSRATEVRYVEMERERINLCLQLSGFILKGASRPLSPGHRVFLRSVVLPLHELTSSATERKQALELIHKYLVFTVVAYLEQAPDDFSFLLSAIFKMWPKSWAGTTAKELLFLNELESLLEVAPPEFYSSQATGELQNLRELSMKKVLFYVSSEHSVLCQKALLFWQNGRLFDLFTSCETWFLPQVLPVLLQKNLAHWNSSVKKKTALILKKYFTDRESHPTFVDVVTGILQSEESLEAYFQKIFEEHGLGESANKVEEEDNEERTAAVVPQKLLDLSVMNIVIEKKIGHGSFGIVHSAYKVVMGKTRSQWPRYAVKEIHKEHEKVAFREIESMDLVAHPNCVSMVGYYVTSKTINLVLEFAQKGDLHSLLINFVRLEMENVRFMSGEIIAALSAFHVNNYVFGDLKPENVLVFSNNHVKLCDFGAVRKVEEMQQGAPLEGTFIYLSPELVSGQGGGIESDFWSLGCLFYQMMFGHPPFKVQRERLVPINEKHSFLSNKQEYQVIPIKGRATESDKLRDLAIDLLRALFVKDPTGRAGRVLCEKHHFYEDLGISSFDELSGMKPPDLKEPVRKEKTKASANNTAWTQRAYSMMVSPVPQKHAFESEEDSSLKMIPENPSDVKTQWRVNGSLPGLDALKVEPPAITESAVHSTHAPHQRKISPMNMRQRALNNKSLGVGTGRKMPQLNMNAMLAHHGAGKFATHGTKRVNKPQQGKKSNKGTGMFEVNNS